MNEWVLRGIYGVLIIYGIWIVYNIFFRKSPYQDEYDKMYNNILKSNKYKVKGQYDKDE